MSQRPISEYRVTPVSAEEVERQRSSYDSLIAELGAASPSKIQAALAARELADPDPGIAPEVLERLRQRLAKPRTDRVHMSR